MAQGWKEQLQERLSKKLGAKVGNALADKYNKGFPTSYFEQCTVIEAVGDIEKMEQLSASKPLDLDFFQSTSKTDYPLHLKLFQLNDTIPLSDVLPMLENMDLRTFCESPYKVTLTDKDTVWVSDFSVTYAKPEPLDITKLQDLFQDAFTQVRFGKCENDGFNKLVLSAQLSWREVIIIRAYAKYLQQAGFRYSQPYIEKTMANYPQIAKNIVNLFLLKFSLQQKASHKKAIEEIEKNLQSSLEAVTSLDEDRILRRFWDLINATLRTNYYQTTKDGTQKDYLSFKLNSAEVPELPLPRPLFEIFVYSPRFEGIHLRSAKVARGGIRWSDRREDFRTEVLGLMKAQKVKNAVIVPSGAKGGFVLKAVPPQASRDVIQREVVACYTSFISGLLDLTDNIKNNKTIPPKNVVCFDEPDPYLVVAADKGTATFSDTANGISKTYDFWLGDAFASGGSAGYDHKKIGITARGAWESVKRHFRELDINAVEKDITVVGIGDMSGDVFGNGMIYSANIKLVAAFDHRNIFLDPNPNPEKSYKERVRMFNLPTSSWEDYNSKLISAGGGIYKRSSKSIPLSAEVKKILDVQDNALTPNELIRAILKAPVDLLFNGGIGTYVKAATESNSDVGDKTNEFCRINGAELRCKVVGEGGNLGFTQLGRIEYALQDGLINTDFIDNSAGVDCSDHEVNIKILLDKEVQTGNLTEKKRNQILIEMTEDVANHVLQDNYHQALVMSYSAANSSHYSGLYQSFIKDLETIGFLDRAVEFLPDDKKLNERKSAGQGLTRPELAILLAYAKMYIKHELLKSDLPEDTYYLSALETAFPSLLTKSYSSSMKQHRLKREIIATQLSNQVINIMGITFVYRMQSETGSTIAQIVRAYTVAAGAFDTDKLFKLIGSLNYKVSVKMQYELFHHLRQLLNLATRWYLQGSRSTGDIKKIIAHYSVCIKNLEDAVASLMTGITKTYFDARVEHFTSAGLDRNIARTIAIARAMYTALNVTEVATQNKFDLLKTANIYFDVGREFNLVWFRDQVSSDTREGHWNTLARLSLRDALDDLQRRLSILILQSGKKSLESDQLINAWLKQNEHITQRWAKLMDMMHDKSDIDYTMFFISLRELSNLLLTGDAVSA